MSALIRKIAVAACAAALAMCVAVATAHHSAAQFDFSQRVTIEGVVKKFTVTNPHTWAVVEITDEKRGTRDAEYEGHSASHFYRAGFTRDMVQVGDKIAILIAPRKDGEDGGFIQAFTANGKTIGFGGLSPETGRRVEGAAAEPAPTPAR
jgi:arabinogalactan endo-1,4-beta-galactosidase